jgi:glutathione S-transferase
MKILGSAGSPFVRKVRVIAAEKGLPVEYVVQRANAPGSPVPQMNPLGKIPVLALDNGEMVYDSVVIGEYLDGVKAEPRLVPADFEGRIAVKRYEALGDGLAEVIVNISHDLGPMKATELQAEYIARQYGKLERTLGTLERAIAGRTWLWQDRFSLADICAGYGILYLDLAMKSYDWRSKYPGLAPYGERLLARESFKSTIPAA